MALELYMLGLIVKDMGKSLEFYRRLGLAVPEGSEEQTHVQIKMESGLVIFLDSRPTRWDPKFAEPPQPALTGGYGTLLEFYMKSQDEVDRKYAELTGYGYQSHSAPYTTPFGMYFALLKDPDGNAILLSAEVSKSS